MTSIATAMTHDHRDCDGLLAAAESAVASGDWALARAVFGRFRAALERHFAVEEESLFPAFERRTGTSAGPTQVMRSEHAEMRDLAERLAAAVEGGDADEFLGLAETMNLMAQQHNMKEEHVLYTIMDEAFEGETDTLLARLYA